MTATLGMVPLARIRASADNPRSDFDDERMAELIESVKRHGIITPLTLSCDGDGRYAIIAGERRYRAAKAAKLREVPAQVREVDGEALMLAVAENVIRADLSPIEEARAYRRLVDEHGDTAKVAKLVGKSEPLLSDRLDLLRLPDQTQELLAARRLPLACAPALVRIAEREPRLADLASLWLVERPREASAFPAAPGEIVDDVLRAEWTDDGSPVHPVAYSVGGFRGPLVPSTDDRLAVLLEKLGEHAQTVERAYAELPAIPQASEHDWHALQAEERRERECFALTEADADAARAFGCLLELPGWNGREHRYVTDAEWLADRLVQKIAAHAAEEADRKQGKRDAPAPNGSQDDAAKEERRREREQQYGARVSARSRNLDLGAALACWQPKLDTEAVKLLGSLVLEEHGRAAAWAHRLCVDQPTTTNKQGKVTTRYPRGAEAEREHQAEAMAALARARTPEDAAAVVLRLLVAQRLADTEGLPNADRQGIYEPQLLASSELIGKLARRVAPASVKKHLAEQQAGPPDDRPAPEEEALDEAA
ncbi:MAG: ParB/RepB/Spo0J family partition protein [Gaiellaceae bacterium MAG52_C11]|nr:ParB/RepB/Spo0J family partition protein [Candidatus Gaiellasilicea maunaloa]